MSLEIRALAGDRFNNLRRRVGPERAGELGFKA
jgi:hypothetical protein